MIMDVILRVVTKLFLPFMLMFALFVQWHADYGPGGGFQAGVIAAASVILYAIVFGTVAAQRAVPPVIVEAMVPLGVLIFGGVGHRVFLSVGDLPGVFHRFDLLVDDFGLLFTDVFGCILLRAVASCKAKAEHSSGCDGDNLLHGVPLVKKAGRRPAHLVSKA